jgi:hypothetical protein
MERDDRGNLLFSKKLVSEAGTWDEAKAIEAAVVKAPEYLVVY